jgi:phage tail-like protein
MSTDPLFTFRFELSFVEAPLAAGRSPRQQKSRAPVPAGAFSECTGLEATMEPRVIRAGGANHGAFQRVGPVSFATVVLKRGLARDGRLFTWFERVATGDYSHRCTVNILLKELSVQSNASGGQSGQLEPEEQVIFTWTLQRALPIKFKAADFNAKATEVGIEELHLAHEGLSFEAGAPKGAKR